MGSLSGEVGQTPGGNADQTAGTTQGSFRTEIVTPNRGIMRMAITISRYAKRTGRTVVADTQCHTKSDGNMAVLLSQVLRPLSTISGELHIGPSE